MITIYTDGATEGHNGKLGTVTHCGIGFYCPEKNYKFSKRIEAISNNEAEFEALIMAMKWALQNKMIDVEFYSDSIIVVRRANKKNFKTQKSLFGEVNYRKSTTKPRKIRMNYYQDIVLDLAKHFRNVSFHWTPRELNKEADYLSKSVLLKK